MERKDQQINVRVGEQISDRDFNQYYEMTKKTLCRGDFFEIRQVRSKKTQRIFAAKIFRKLEIQQGKKYKDDPTGRSYVENELKILAKLDHPNILKVLETFEDKFKIYFIIDDFKGGSLFEKIIYDGCLPEVDAAAISAYLVSSLKYLHKNGVIIRNLRPETIFFEEKDSFDIKLIDLSLAIEKSDYQDNIQDYLYEEYQRHHPVFRAPELMHKYKHYDESVDIWSCGCIIFNMVTGIPLFYESDISGLKNNIMHGFKDGYYPDFENKSKDLRELIGNMIKLKPEERITSEELISNPWINSANQRYKSLSRTIVTSAFQNMKSFKIAFQLQRVALLHMAKSYINKKEKDNLKMIFDALDEEKDGEIELKEFVIQLDQKFDIQVKVPEMEKIMKQCDLDYDGKIQFTEFLIAACNKRSLFTQYNIEQCFNYIDADGDGEIQKLDLQQFLGEELDDSYIKSMIEEADVNGDGGLEVDEFAALMNKILKSTERNR